MTGLSFILPRDKLIDRCASNVIFEEYGRNDLEKIAKINPQSLHGIAANVWNRIVFKRWHPVNPLQFARYFKTSDPLLHQAISDFLRVEVIRDIYYVKGWKTQKRKSNLIVEMLVAWVYRNDLQLADITFINPEIPIPNGQQRFSCQTHKGFGLLPTLLSNLQYYAEQLGCEQLTLTAAMLDQVGLFTRYGFTVEDSQSGRMAMALGAGIPMERNVRGSVQNSSDF